jgi:hypothetical protein
VARQVITTLIDDLDGSTAEETVRFGLDGVSYEIDVSGRNGSKLRRAFEPYITAGSRIGRGGIVSPTGPGKASPARRSENAAVRVWAAEHGYQVNERGRIPAAIVDAYQRRDRPGRTRIAREPAKAAVSRGGKAAAKRAPRKPAKAARKPAKATRK